MKQVARFIDSLENRQVNFIASSISTYEMLAEGVHKGTAVRVLSEMLGIPYDHTAAIGDYFNDFDMLKSVFLPAACGQAPRRCTPLPNSMPAIAIAAQWGIF